MIMRHDGRQPDQLRPLTFQRGFTRQAPGSVLVQMGRTMVLCTCSVEETVPPFLVGTGKGWLTAERSEERRVGKEWRSRGAPDHGKRKHEEDGCGVLAARGEQ